jgi:hypothetical protein
MDSVRCQKREALMKKLLFSVWSMVILAWACWLVVS